MGLRQSERCLSLAIFLGKSLDIGGCGKAFLGASWFPGMIIYFDIVWNLLG
jgi:hypothetical protein